MFTTTDLFSRYLGNEKKARFSKHFKMAQLVQHCYTYCHSWMHANTQYKYLLNEMVWLVNKNTAFNSTAQLYFHALYFDGHHRENTRFWEECHIAKFSPNTNCKQLSVFNRNQCKPRVPTFQFIISRQDNIYPFHKQKHFRKENGGQCLSKP